jgi:hypothetical protein
MVLSVKAGAVWAGRVPACLAGLLPLVLMVTGLQR